MKTQINKFLKKHGMRAYELARLADVKLWSLRRYLAQEDAGINLKTAVKLQAAMKGYPCPKKRRLGKRR